MDTTMFENTFSFPSSAELNMYYCGKRIQTPNHTYGPEIRTHFLVVLICDGHATLFHKNGNIRMGGGDMLVMFPNERIHYAADRNTLWTISWVGVYGSLVCSFFDKLGITPENPVYSIGNTEIFKRIFEEIYRTSLSDATADKLKCISLLYEFFSELTRLENIKNKPDYIDEAKHIIEYNYNKNIQVSEIAKSLHLPVCYFSRIFKEREGVSPKQYILNKKIDRAVQLLRNGEHRISEVSYSVGVGDPLYFSRLFKNKTGMSPSDFAAKNRSHRHL